MTIPGGAGGRDEEVTIDANLKDNVSRPARTAAGSLDDLGDNADQAARRLAVLQAQADRTGHSLELLGIKQRASSQSFASADEKMSYIADEYKRLTANVEQHTTATDKNTKAVKKSETSFKDVMKTINKVFGVMKSGLPIVKTLGMAWAASSAIIEGAHLVQPVLQVASALSSLASFAALIPTAFGSAAAILGTVKLAVSGVGDAIQAAMSGDMAKLDQAIAQLSPNAALFVENIMQWIPALKGLRGEVQDALFGPIIGNLDTLMNSVLGPLGTDMTRLAGLIGNIVAHIMTFMSSVQGIKVLNTIFDNASHLVQAFSDGLDPVLKGFGDLITTVSPTFNSMTGEITTLMDKFGGWLSQISQSGKLTDMLGEAKKVAHDLWDILKDVGSIFSGVVSAANNGQDPLTNIATALGNVATFVNSISGQNSLIGMFEQLNGLSQSLSPVIQMIVQTLLPAILPIITTLVTTLSPIVVQLGQIISQYVAPALQQIITGLGPGLQSLVQAIGQVFQALAPIWGPLATAISSIVSAIAPILGVVAQELAPFLAEVATEITVIFKALQPFIQIWADAASTILTMFLGPLMNLFTALFPLIVQVLDAFNTAIEPIAPLLGDIAKQFVSQVTPELMKLVPIIANQLVPAFVNLANSIGKDLIKEIMDLMPQMPALTKAFIELIDAGIKLFTIMAPYYPMFLDLIAKIIEITMYTGVWQALLYVLIGVIEIAAISINGIIDLIKILSAVHKDFTDGLHDVENVFSTVWNNIADIVKNVVGTVSNYIQQLKTDLRDAKNSLQDLVQGGALSLLLNGVAGRWMGGPVEGGKPYMVGEMGPEKYVSSAGDVKDIGVTGPQMMTFPNTGLVIPNNLLNQFDAMQSEAVMRARMMAASQRAEEQLLSNMSAPRPQTTHTVENHYSVPVNVYPQSEMDVTKAVRKALAEADQNAKERAQFG